MICVDHLLPCKRRAHWPYPEACHLFVLFMDPPHRAIATLHEFAAEIGLSRSWFQEGDFPHYDLTAPKRMKAIASGATPVALLTAAKAIRTWREHYDPDLGEHVTDEYVSTLRKYQVQCKVLYPYKGIAPFVPMEELGRLTPV